MCLQVLCERTRRSWRNARAPQRVGSQEQTVDTGRTGARGRAGGRGPEREDDNGVVRPAATDGRAQRREPTSGLRMPTR